MQKRPENRTARRMQKHPERGKACFDGKDNDHDGKKDCDDPDCYKKHGKGKVAQLCARINRRGKKNCRHDICTDIANDCCAPGSEHRGCRIHGYRVQRGGVSKYKACPRSGIYQCCR